NSTGSPTLAVSGTVNSTSSGTSSSSSSTPSFPPQAARTPSTIPTKANKNIFRIPSTSSSSSRSMTACYETVFFQSEQIIDDKFDIFTLYSIISFHNFTLRVNQKESRVVGELVRPWLWFFQISPEGTNRKFFNGLEIVAGEEMPIREVGMMLFRILFQHFWLIAFRVDGE